MPTRTISRPTSLRECCGSPAPAAAPPTAPRSSRTPAFSPSSGIVLVTISLSIGDASIRVIAGPDSTPCTALASTRVAPLSMQRLRGLLNRARRVDDVVGDDADAAAHVADDVHHFRRAVLAAPLVDDRQIGVQPLRVGARALGAAGVGRHDRHRPEVLPRQVLDDDRRREQVVHRNVEEPLNLRLVQVHRQHAVGARRAQQVGHELGRDRHARLVLAILPRVAVVRNDGRDARGRRPAERVDHHAQLDQVLVHRRATSAGR